MHLSEYMAAKDLTDEAVANAIGRSRVSVSRYRRRLIRPDWEAAERIEKFTDGDVSLNDWTGCPDTTSESETERAAS